MKFLALFLLDTVFSGWKSQKNVKPAADIPRTVKMKLNFFRIRQFDIPVELLKFCKQSDFWESGKNIFFPKNKSRAVNR